MIALVERLEIDYIFPAYDDVIVALSHNREKIPATILAPSREVCDLTRSKLLTYQKLSSVVKTPRIFQAPEQVNAFPVFIKPDRGQGAFGVKRINDLDELKQVISVTKDPVIPNICPVENLPWIVFPVEIKDYFLVGLESA